VEAKPAHVFVALEHTDILYWADGVVALRRMAASLVEAGEAALPQLVRIKFNIDDILI
jgi:hypothetical protein